MSKALIFVDSCEGEKELRSFLAKRKRSLPSPKIENNAKKLDTLIPSKKKEQN